ncbi:ankyrin repeat-containing domain protein [Mycena belliarum]|uniref:Ankyrin repeat-containing domain protein n=1 Tax=Mycena belliarum TaxID=1033014 RepID=A0AAD6TMH9_9AGAR|nr:ankyrin repeat-containing domain protein [Mycena belliae]KAJ7081569.1 ankyrin repeat-containing domain protein [Mycena belliae]
MTTGADASKIPPETLDFANRMFEAARAGNAELVLAAVDAGLPVNILNGKGNSLLMLAAYAGHLDLTKKLLERGGDPNLLNDLGQSMIAGAVFKGHDDVVRALAEKGADPRLGQPNAIQAAHMFSRTHLMSVLGANDGDIGPDVPSPLPQEGNV